MPSLAISNFLIAFILGSMLMNSAAYAINPIDQKASSILNQLTVREKIGQKLMLDFRTFEDQDLTELPSTIKNLLDEYAVGGVILFSNNLKNIAQITTLSNDFQKTMQTSQHLPLLIGTDQEGGIVSRLPYHEAVTFPGNMALAAASLGTLKKSHTAKVGKLIAQNLKALGINLNFAPVVDVNINAQNPVIHVRAFSDDQKLVGELGRLFVQASQKIGVGTCLKHFPGHGDTNVDSHVGLPVVKHSLKEAWQIDLYPFQKIIKTNPPDLIMTAHIQYPALDNTTLWSSKKQVNLITPATLSRHILTDILRRKLAYSGLIITDAMNMAAISDHFEASDATVKAFAAGADIVLMPLAVHKPLDTPQLEELYNNIEQALHQGILDRKEFDASVLRIIKLKIKLGLLKPDDRSLEEKIAHAKAMIGNADQKRLEASTTDQAITLVQNNHHTLPLKLALDDNIFILMPWWEQALGLVEEIKRLQQDNVLPKELSIRYRVMADTDLETIKKEIVAADVIIVGHIATRSAPLSQEPQDLTRTQSLLGSLVFPTIPKTPHGIHSPPPEIPFYDHLESSRDEWLAYQSLQYAGTQHKKTIFISLLAPYDLPNYHDVADAMLVGYDAYGYLSQENGFSYYRGPSMQALIRIIFGIKPATAKLPLNIPDPQDPTKIVYPRGFGLTTE